MFELPSTYKELFDQAKCDDCTKVISEKHGFSHCDVCEEDFCNACANKRIKQMITVNL